MSGDKSIYTQDTSNNAATMFFIPNTNQLWSQDVFKPTAYFEATKLASEAGIQPTRMCLLQAASNVDSTGHRVITPWRATESSEWIQADGVHITEVGAMTMFQTADCAAVGVYDKRTKTSLFYHCGRPAGMPIDGRSIMTDALDRMAPDGDFDQLEIVVCGMICGAHFPHESGLGRIQADAYLNEYGPDVFSDVQTRSLDMKKVLIKVHTKRGLSPNQITFFGPTCTYDDPDSISHRQSLVANTPRDRANSVVWIHR